MTLKQLRAFLALAQTLSFAQAGERLHVSQPALSLTIKGLEDSLGGRLLSRTTRSVALTPEGEALLPLARRLLAEWDNAEEELRQRFTLQLGRVGVAAMPAFAANRLPPLLKLFRQRHPKISVTVHDVINEQVIEMVRDRHVELGIGFEPQPSTAVAFEALYLDRFVAVLPAHSPLAQQTQVSWAELLQQDFITLQRPSAVRLLLEEDLAAYGEQLTVTFESHQLATVGRMVACGLGVSAVPSLCIKQMREAGAHCVTLIQPVIERQIGLLTRADHELSIAAHALRTILLSSDDVGLSTLVESLSTQSL